VLSAQDSAIPRAVEVRAGVFVLRGTPDEDTCQAMKRQKISHVIDLRRDEEPNLTCQSESTRLADLGIQYMRYAIGRAPLDSDFDFLRMLIREMPKGSRVLVHCADGNRAAAAVCPWLVLELGMPMAEAMRLADTAGLRLPDTEAALRRYLARHGKA
jgi:protein tyrosine phosphatase (PTP) superfamily phosphohydrolase (DUF442 family)